MVNNLLRQKKWKLVFQKYGNLSREFAFNILPFIIIECKLILFILKLPCQLAAFYLADFNTQTLKLYLKCILK